MDKFIEAIIKFIERLPITLQGIILFVLSGGFVVYKILNNDKFRRAVFMALARRMNKVTKMSLFTAPVFYRKELYARKIENMKFIAEPEKTDVFRLLLRVKLNTDIDCLYQLLSNEQYIGMRKEELIAYLNKHLNDMLNTFDSKLRETFMKEYGKEKGTRIYNFVMHSQGGYIDHRIIRVDRVLHEINEVIAKSQIFDNNYERIAAYMNEIQYAINLVVTQTEQMFRDFNGEIRQIVNS